MLEPRVDQAEVVEPVIERRAGNRDARVRHVGEVRQAHAAGLVDLAEDDLPLGAVQRPPGADAPLHRPAHPFGQRRMAPLNLLEDRHRPQARRRLQQRHDLGVEDVRQRVRPTAVPRLYLQRRRSGIGLEAIGRGAAERRLGRRHRRRVGLSELHVEPHLVIGDMAAGQRRDPSRGEDPSVSGRSRSPDATPSGSIRRIFPRARASGRATPSLRLEPSDRLSHLDCRASLTLIVARHPPDPCGQAPPDT